MPGAWKLYKALGRCERPLQAPPLPKQAMRVLAGCFQKRGHKNAATLIVLALHHLLRTNEFMSLVGTDLAMDAGLMVVILREMKTSKRSGVNQEMTITSAWLTRRMVEARRIVLPGLSLLEMPPSTSRRLWKQACRDTGLGRGYTPYSLGRGGATSPFFRACGSFDVVVDRGGWLNAHSCRTYISCAFAELGNAELDKDWFDEFARHLAVA